MSKTSIVLGLGFGDEGKGITTSFLTAQSERPIIVRANGGHQAGHGVIHKGMKHTFSCFGAGTLQGAPTFWSRYCTFFPTAVKNEYNALKELGLSPKLYVDALCPVTTPFDIQYNENVETAYRHGSVGVGFGATIQRQEDNYKLFVQDLFYDSILKAKLDNIINYYSDNHSSYWSMSREEFELTYSRFIEDIKIVRDIISVIGKEGLPESYDHYIFEGAQGILLDMDFGFFPNVTRSNTTSKNALSLISELELRKPEIYYVTRSYQTRHGHGFMSNEDKPPQLVNNHHETNVEGEWQGKFRTGMLDVDLLNYAIKCDDNFSNGLTKNIVVTCLDQTDGEVKVTRNGTVLDRSAITLAMMLDCKFKRIIKNSSPDSEELIAYYKEDEILKD